MLVLVTLGEVLVEPLEHGIGLCGDAKLGRRLLMPLVDEVVLLLALGFFTASDAEIVFGPLVALRHLVLPLVWPFETIEPRFPAFSFTSHRLLGDSTMSLAGVLVSSGTLRRSSSSLEMSRLSSFSLASCCFFAARSASGDPFASGPP